MRCSAHETLQGLEDSPIRKNVDSVGAELTFNADVLMPPYKAV